MTDSGAGNWRRLDTPPASGAWNMALDAALLEGIAAGGAPVLRFYRWDPPCLSLGRNQPAQGRYDAAKLRAEGIEVVRRATGGRAVLHHHELTYTAAFPERMLGGPRAAYAALNRALVAGLRHLGIAAELQPLTGRRAPVPSVAPCFAEPVEGEVVARGRKLVGSAQLRSRGALLQHGSLLLADDQTRVAELLADGTRVDELVETNLPIALAELCNPVPSWIELTAALSEGWALELGATPKPCAVSPVESARAAALGDHFRDPAWTWHR